LSAPPLAPKQPQTTPVSFPFTKKKKKIFEC
jgi:hypothetical protein